LKTLGRLVVNKPGRPAPTRFVPDEARNGSVVMGTHGKKIDGTCRYRIHMLKELSIDVFWSISIYEVEADGLGTLRIQRNTVRSERSKPSNDLG
jgi:hypothetical protein